MHCVQDSFSGAFMFDFVRHCLLGRHTRDKDWIQRKLDIFREWYNTERPMWLHGARTLEEVWMGIALPQPAPLLERNPIKPAIIIERVHYRGDFHLPTLAIQIIDSVEIVA
jgi:hypothetical protein